ncbi:MULTISPECIES: ExbD/TolR family protein [Corallincola]|uniref:Biopolymer transporter ExbD n=3 Tax=Corallincola TaxID=1775176 RepID=A0A368NIW5_9GAMM|nr:MULTISPECIES: biopolymer transporter ExbD [Corallincola]RCU50050.1 biopolymer transporter ExbD [Corallincola holothuriorum]TAA44968.1 biopolymer transporter ExbD [Corallincola spongiicola]TCI03772.1 biopolymer transporter ExbD [Corallincola luteus]
MRRLRRPQKKDAELDITSFMNLMIVLVPVLLLGMVFSHISVLDIQLPEGGADNPDQKDPPKLLELIIRQDGMALNYPAGVPLKRLANKEQSYDFDGLSLYLQDLKRAFQQKGIEKRDIIILMEPDIDYQTLVTAMDTVRSFRAVVVASDVDAELFPEISLGDAPAAAKAKGAKR